MQYALTPRGLSGVNWEGAKKRQDRAKTALRKKLAAPLESAADKVPYLPERALSCGNDLAEHY